MVAEKIQENEKSIQYRVELKIAELNVQTIVWFDKVKFKPHISNPNLRAIYDEVFDKLIKPQLEKLEETLAGKKQLRLDEMINSAKKTNV